MVEANGSLGARPSAFNSIYTVFLYSIHTLLYNIFVFLYCNRNVKDSYPKFMVQSIPIGLW